MIKDGFLRFCDDPEIACCRGEAELGQLRQENIRLRAELLESQRMPEQEKSMEQEAKVCAGGCIRNYADPLPHCDDCSFRQPDEKTTDISYERAAEILDTTHREHYDSMNEIERAANPTTEEAIKYLEGMIFTQDFSPATLRAVAVNTMAIDALREQAERSRGCEWCKALSFNPDIGGCQLVFFKSKKHPKGEHAISVSVFDEYGEEQEPVLVQIDNCIRCGKRLEVEP